MLQKKRSSFWVYFKLGDQTSRITEYKWNQYFYIKIHIKIERYIDCLLKIPKFIFIWKVIISNSNEVYNFLYELIAEEIININDDRNDDILDAL